MNDEVNWGNAPDWLKAAQVRKPHLTPEVAKAEADRDAYHALADAQRETTKQKKLEIEIEEKRNERERIKRRIADLPALADPNSIILEFAMSTDTATVDLEYLVDPYLPARCVVGFYGRGATGKSPFLASIAAHISETASTLWISVEEPADWIKVRHIKAGGADKTLQVVTAIATKEDAQGRVVGSNFNVYEHLEPSIVKAICNADNAGSPPVRFVVLDTVVGLTTWTANAGPNSDEGVKRLLAYLQALAECRNVTIAIIGHANKGKHEHFADVVMGATAWTNSPRLSFVHAADRREEYSFVIRVAKTNLVTFGATYRTEPVHTLYSRQDGPDTVLCKVIPGPVVWGDADSMELWEEATAVPKDEDGEFPASRMPTVVEHAIQAIVEVLMTTTVIQLTRNEVEQKIGRAVGRREWRKVDAHLKNHPTIQVERGASNQLIYKRRE